MLERQPHNRVYHKQPWLSPLCRRQKEAWFAGKWRLLQRVGGLVAALAVHDRTGMLRSGGHSTAGAWRLEGLLGLLRPGVLAEVEIECHPAPPPAAILALPRLAPSLTALNLDARQLPPEVAAVLPQLSHLASLRLGANAVPQACLAAVLQLTTSLTRLELESSFLPLPPLQPLTVLQRLRCLGLYDDGNHDDPLLLPAPAAFPNLASLTVHMTHSQCEVPGALVCTCVCMSPKRSCAMVVLPALHPHDAAG